MALCKTTNGDNHYMIISVCYFQFIIISHDLLACATHIVQQLFQYFPERYHDKVALLHQRMWYLKVGFIHCNIVIQKDVNVDGTVMVHALTTFLRPSQLPFYKLGHLKKLTWREVCGHAYAPIDKLVFTSKAPRLSLYQGGLPNHITDELTYLSYSFGNSLVPVAEITAEGQINSVCISH